LQTEENLTSCYHNSLIRRLKDIEYAKVYLEEILKLDNDELFKLGIKDINEALNESK